jgi:NADPH-dependent curcumin reductase CurA
MNSVNRQVILKSRPVGIPEAENFDIVESRIPEVGPGQILLRNLYVTAEPGMRGWVNAVSNYMNPVPLGSVMRSTAVARVEISRNPGYSAGDLVAGTFGWQEYALVEESEILRRVASNDLPVSTALGVLGVNGFTAHYGLLTLGQPRAGETVVVSTAAGAVGSAVGQIAKIMGCRTVGITGGEKKRQLCIDTFGFDAAVDYKAPDFREQLEGACVGGVDVYFDNTAGRVSDVVFEYLRPRARVVVCGTTSVSSWDPWPIGPRVERHLLVKRVRMEGFVIFDHPDAYDAAHKDLEAWVRNGQIRYLEDILVGIESAPDSIAGLYRGENMGKRLIQLAVA